MHCRWYWRWFYTGNILLSVFSLLCQTKYLTFDFIAFVVELIVNSNLNPYLLLSFITIFLSKFLLMQIWNIKPGWGSRPDIYVPHGHSDEITGIKFSSDGRILLSRSFDGSLKVLVCLWKICFLRWLSLCVAYSLLFFFSNVC